jgi:hypothetical protein
VLKPSIDRFCRQPVDEVTALETARTDLGELVWAGVTPQ